MSASPVTVYWRPGCGFCAGLLRGLERNGLAFERVNIWDDPEAAAMVRSVANGNETVPTVTIAGTALVNPSPAQVMTAVAEHAPAHLPEGYEGAQPGKVGQFVNRILGG